MDPYSRGIRRLLAKLGFGHAPDLHLAIEAAVERHQDAQQTRLGSREWRSEAALALVCLAGGIALIVFAPQRRPLDVGLALALMAAWAVASRVRFYDGAGYAVPTQLVLVPSLLLLPPTIVPLLAATGMALGTVERCLRGRSHPQRLPLSLGDSLYSFGPVLVLTFAGPATPTWHAWPIYLLALGAQFVFDVGVSMLRDWLVIGLGAAVSFPLVTWTWFVDGVLAIVGLMATIAARDEPYTALLVLPLMGLLALFSRERDARIEQSRELSRAYHGTTLLLSDVLDGDDEYTAFHSRGVVQLSVAVGERLGLDERQMRNVEFGALLHDVGKIAIPKEILNKPGKLSKDEWFVMETHTIEGQKMLDRVGGVLGEVGQIVRSSHERWDGSGYPDALAGDAIPLESTIVSVCDAFNAMTTHRPYRRALSVADAVAELTANRGTQFAPRAIDALLELIAEDEAMMVGPVAPRAELDEITLVVPDVAVERAG